MKVILLCMWIAPALFFWGYTIGVVENKCDTKVGIQNMLVIVAAAATWPVAIVFSLYTEPRPLRCEFWKDARTRT